MPTQAPHQDHCNFTTSLKPVVTTSQATQAEPSNIWRIRRLNHIFGQEEYIHHRNQTRSRWFQPTNNHNSPQTTELPYSRDKTLRRGHMPGLERKLRQYYEEGYLQNGREKNEKGGEGRRRNWRRKRKKEWRWEDTGRMGKGRCHTIFEWFFTGMIFFFWSKVVGMIFKWW